ncbi:hypothetical protein G4B11_004129 [Aspergillus flavus]|nr:hypothetical protein G4B11_004129 [Aspergillus flavus]
MRFTLSSLALLVAATAVAADNVITLAVPGSNDSEDNGMSVLSSLRFKIAGINGATTSLLPNCTARATATTTASTSTATDGFSNGLVNCEMTIVSGPKTFYVAYEGETVERYDMGDKSATGYVTWTTTNGTSTMESVESSVVPVTSAAFTITGTAASVTPLASASASAKASVSGSANATSTSASASASHTENAAMRLPTGHSLFAAGGAAMALALAIA